MEEKQFHAKDCPCTFCGKECDYVMVSIDEISFRCADCLEREESKKEMKQTEYSATIV